MSIRKKEFKQKLAEYAYFKPSMEKRAVHLNKSLLEINSILSSGKKGKKT